MKKLQCELQNLNDGLEPSQSALHNWMNIYQLWLPKQKADLTKLYHQLFQRLKWWDHSPCTNLSMLSFALCFIMSRLSSFHWPAVAGSKLRVKGLVCAMFSSCGNCMCQMMKIVFVCTCIQTRLTDNTWKKKKKIMQHVTKWCKIAMLQSWSNKWEEQFQIMQN